MSSATDQPEKPFIYVVGGSGAQGQELAEDLSYLYTFKMFNGESQIIRDLETNTPTAIIVDEVLPPRGGASFIAKTRKFEKTKFVPIVFIADTEHAEVVAEATSYDRVVLVDRPFTPDSIRGGLSKAINAQIEAKWEDIEPTQKAALFNTLNSFNSFADLIHEGQPIPFAEVRDSCAPLVEAVQNNNFKSILSGVSEHDNYTYVHSLRVAIFLSLFGNMLGIKGDDLMILATGGLLHDVGKMHIPHGVLNKPGKLTDEEFVIMKSHVNCTVDFLNETSELPKGVLIVAGQHHEKLDGTGYPHGIEGKKLNELARMASIIDIFSALTDRRVYKDPIPPDHALRIMANMKSQLDQQLFSVFREMLLDATTP